MTTTLDVARAAVREGVLDVTVIALESPEEIPADPEEIDEAEAEGITILYRRGPHRFVGDDGAVTGLETIARALGVRRRRPVRPDVRRRAPRTCCRPTRSSSPSARPPIVDFLGGARRSSAPGRRDPGRPGHAAHVAPADLGRRRRGQGSAQPHRRHRRRPAGRRVDPRRARRRRADAPAPARPASAGRAAPAPGLPPPVDRLRRHRPPVPVPATPTERRIGFAEVEIGYDAQDAWLESLRCLRCFDNIMLDPGLCILCGLCVDVCPTELHHDRPRRPPRSGRRVPERAAPRRGPVHPLRSVRQPVPARRAVDGARAGGRPTSMTDPEEVDGRPTARLRTPRRPSRSRDALEPEVAYAPGTGLAAQVERSERVAVDVPPSADRDARGVGRCRGSRTSSCTSTR